MDKPKVYIIDDSLMFRAMLETMVSREPAFEICGIASSVDQALADIGWMLPDIILLDLNFREGRDGFDFLAEIEGHWHRMHVILISTDARRGSDICDRAFTLGADACIDKAQVMTSGRELVALMKELIGRSDPHSFAANRAISLPAMRH